MNVRYFLLSLIATLSITFTAYAENAIHIKQVGSTTNRIQGTVSGDAESNVYVDQPEDADNQNDIVIIEQDAVSTQSDIVRYTEFGRAQLAVDGDVNVIQQQPGILTTPNLDSAVGITTTGAANRNITINQ